MHLILVYIPKYTKNFLKMMLPHTMNFSAFVPISRCDKLDPNKAAKILLNTLNISAFIVITRYTKLDFNATVKI